MQAIPTSKPTNYTSDSTSNFLPTIYQQYIYKSRYSRWLPDKNRRETWTETVARYFDFFQEHLATNYSHDITPYRDELENAVLNLKVVPSMRALMTAGEALKRDNICAYNCAYLAVNRPQAFDEILYILMNGTGVGFSVEQSEVACLPLVAESFYQSDTTVVVADSKLGWAKAFKELLGMLWVGQMPKWDVSKVRPAGSPLKTFGGRASGPEPLVALFEFVTETFRKAAGRKLNSLECHDIVCKIADIVVVGGVRRSALISLSDLSDERMRNAKSGQWFVTDLYRSLANNSAIYNEKPSVGQFMDEWKALYESKSGERGIFNRESARRTVEKLGSRRDPNHSWGVNPCVEILLRDKEFCNLSEVILRANDSEEEIAQKVKWATILGTWQSTLTNFKYISKKWKENCEEERLLGVSLTGIMDCPLTNDIHDSIGLQIRLERWKNVAIETNKELAGKIGINPSAAITCGKPSGTVSQLADAASGGHSRHAPFYIRTVRADKKDPLAKMMVDMGFLVEDDITKPKDNYVFSFPIKSPENALYRDSITAISQLEFWLMYKKHWTEHNPSVTITVKESEWLKVGAWVYDHFDDMTGVSFLPAADHIYKQAPYQDCTKAEYEEMVAKLPKNVDWSLLSQYEKSDNTEGMQTLACAGGSCEL